MDLRSPDRPLATSLYSPLKRSGNTSFEKSKKRSSGNFDNAQTHGYTGRRIDYDVVRIGLRAGFGAGVERAMKVPSGDPRPPLAVAMEWVSQITTVVAEMVLPGLAGGWLDNRWGTGFLALLGFALGLTVGIWHLIVMTRPRVEGSPTSRQGPKIGNDSDSGTGSPAEPNTEQN
jgi:hypothetical protein